MIKKILAGSALALLLASSAAAQVAISGLPMASTLGGGETLPLVQGGVTSKATVSQMTAYTVGAANTWSATQTLAAGTTSLAPLQFQAGTNLTSPSAGAVEWNGTSLFVTQTSGPTRKTIAYADLSNLSGALPIANGGTNATTAGAALTNLGAAPASGAVFTSAAAALAISTPNIGETVTVTAAAPTSTQNYDVLTQSVQYFTTSAANNWTLNLRGNSGTTLNSTMAVGQAMTAVVVTTQGASPFYNNVLQIDGSTVTPKWQGGTAPSAGNASGLDVYTYTVIKTASATYTVLASLVQFK